MGWTKRGVERIKKLTLRQEAEIPVFCDKWNRIARSTEPMDEDRVRDGIERFLIERVFDFAQGVVSELFERMGHE